MRHLIKLFRKPLQMRLTLSMASCSALRSTPDAAEDEAAAARQQRRGAAELAVVGVGATSTATIAMVPLTESLFFPLGPPTERKGITQFRVQSKTRIILIF